MYGKITVGVGTAERRELEVVDFVQAKYIDGRTVSVSQIEDDSMTITVENIPSSGRAAQANIWLSKESVIAVLSTAILYFNLKGQDLEELFKTSIESDKIDYRFSDNLKKKMQTVKIKLPELTPVREAWMYYFLWLHQPMDVKLLSEALRVRRTLSKEEREELTEMSNGNL